MTEAVSEDASMGEDIAHGKRRPGAKVRFVRLPSSPEIALDELKQTLGPEQWDELMKKAYMRSLSATIRRARIPRLQRATDALRVACDELTKLHEECGPVPDFEEGENDEPPPLIGDARFLAIETAVRKQTASACSQLMLCLNEYEGTARGYVPTDRPVRVPDGAGVRLLDSESHDLERYSGEILPAAAAEIGWVVGMDLAYLAVVIGIEEPIVDANEEGRAALETRRSTWDKRLRDARRAMQRPPAHH